MTDLLPPGRDLYWANRRLVAGRLNWPAGAVQICEWVDTDNPDWRTYYRIGVGEQPAGYCSWHIDHYHLEPDMYGATPGELRAAIETHRCHNWPRRQWEPGF